MSTTTPAATLYLAGQPTLNNGRTEVAFIDTSVADWQTLANGVRAGVEVVVIDGAADGLAQMAAWAKGKTGYAAIHVLSHGAEGQVRLGTLTLDTATAGTRAADLAALGAALTETGDLLLYGCNVAAGGTGAGFLDAIASATGADVAASIDLTGANANANWSLESTVGTIGSASALLNPGAWTGALSGDTNWGDFPSVSGSGSRVDLTNPHVQGAFTISWNTGAYAEGESYSLYLGVRTSGVVNVNYTHTPTGSTPTEVIIKKTDGAEFAPKLLTMSWDSTYGGNATWNIQGFRDGQAVTLLETVTHINSSSGYIFQSPAWWNVDEIKITGANLTGRIDNLIYSSFGVRV